MKPCPTRSAQNGQTGPGHAKRYKTSGAADAAAATPAARGGSRTSAQRAVAMATWKVPQTASYLVRSRSCPWRKTRLTRTVPQSACSAQTGRSSGTTSRSSGHSGLPKGATMAAATAAAPSRGMDSFSNHGGERACARWTPRSAPTSASCGPGTATKTAATPELTIAMRSAARRCAFQSSTFQCQRADATVSSTRTRAATGWCCRKTQAGARKARLEAIEKSGTGGFGPRRSRAVAAALARSAMEPSISDFEEEEQSIEWMQEWLDRLAECNRVRIAGRPEGWFVGPSRVPQPANALVFEDGVLTVHPHAKNTIVACGCVADPKNVSVGANSLTGV